MSKILKQILILVCLIAILVLPYFVFAQVDPDSMRGILEGTGKNAGFAAATNRFTMSSIAGTAVNVFLSILGIYFIILVIYGGYNYMSARGDEEKVTKALATIQTAIIGVIIVVSSYALFYFIFQKLLTNTT